MENFTKQLDIEEAGVRNTLLVDFSITKWWMRNQWWIKHKTSR